MRRAAVRCSSSPFSSPPSTSTTPLLRSGHPLGGPGLPRSDLCCGVPPDGGCQRWALLARPVLAVVGTPGGHPIDLAWMVCGSHSASSRSDGVVLPRLGSHSGKRQWRTVGLVPDVDATAWGGFGAVSWWCSWHGGDDLHGGVACCTTTLVVIVSAGQAPSRCWAATTLVAMDVCRWESWG
jgi:hypothetical protein